MKRAIYTIGTVFLLGGMMFLSSCKGRKGGETKAPKGETEVIVHCSGSDYFSTKEFMRANAVGESLDQATAKKKALNNAKTDLAGSLNTLMKSVTDNYVNSREFNNQEDIEERFEALSREVIEQELMGIITICERTFKTTEGKYKTYIALEQSGADIVSAINEKLSNDEKLRIDYDYEKFKETFEKEMEKMAGS